MEWEVPALFCLSAFAMEIKFLLVLATGAQGKKTLLDLSRKSSEKVLKVIFIQFSIPAWWILGSKARGDQSCFSNKHRHRNPPSDFPTVCIISNSALLYTFLSFPHHPPTSPPAPGNAAIPVLPLLRKTPSFTTLHPALPLLCQAPSLFQIFA